MRAPRLYPAILFVTIALAPCASRVTHADPPSKTPSLSEIRDVRDAIEAKHQQQLRDIQNGLAINSYSSDEALMMKMKVEREYKDRLEVLSREEAAAYNALDASQRPKAGSESNRAPTNAALPRFQSQSVITYPQGGDAPPAEEKPHREGETRNVGFGTRELEF